MGNPQTAPQTVIQLTFNEYLQPFSLSNPSNLTGVTPNKLKLLHDFTRFVDSPASSCFYM